MMRSQFILILDRYSVNKIQECFFKEFLQEFLFKGVKTYLRKKSIHIYNIGTPKVNKLGVVEAVIR